ncbi:hypothetical protein [Enterococcus olivae]
MRKIGCLIGLLGIFVFSACSSNQVTSAAIQQILSAPDSHQFTSLYILEDGEWFVDKRYRYLINWNREPSKLAEKQSEQETAILQELQQEFPEEALTVEGTNLGLEKTVSKGKITIDESKKEVRLQGKDFEKTFRMDEQNSKRLIDESGNEYELRVSIDE